MNRTKEIEDIYEKNKLLNRKIINTMLMTMISYIILKVLYYYGLVVVFPMIDVTLAVYGVDGNIRSSVQLILNLFSSYLPFASFIIGNIKISKTRVELRQSTEKLKNCVEAEELERQKPMMGSIMERFEELPREKQMRLLNYIKSLVSLEKSQRNTDVDLSEDDIHIKIDSLKDKNVSVLQNEMENILFPNFNDNNKSSGYTRKK